MANQRLNHIKAGPDPKNTLCGIDLDTLPPIKDTSNKYCGLCVEAELERFNDLACAFDQMVVEFNDRGDRLSAINAASNPDVTFTVFEERTN